MRKIFNNIFPCSKKKLKPILDFNKRHFKINQLVKQSINEPSYESIDTNNAINERSWGV